MWQRFFFCDKGLFLQNLHPVVSLAYIGVLLVLSFLFNHPLYLFGLLVAVVLAILTVDGLAVWLSYLKLSLYISILIMLINLLVVKVGQTVIWWGPDLPVLGQVRLSLETLSFGVTMCLRLVTVISIFCLLNLMVHPDKILYLFAGFSSKSALVLVLATRMFPLLFSRLQSIREVQELRGMHWEQGSLIQRIKNTVIFFHILVLSALEDSLEIAEAMQVRAFGSGLRSYYHREVFRNRDFICLGSSLLAIVLGIYVQVHGYSTVEFYPVLEPLVKGPMTFIGLAAVFIFLSLPIIFSWGWTGWPCIRARI